MKGLTFWGFICYIKDCYINIISSILAPGISDLILLSICHENTVTSYVCLLLSQRFGMINQAIIRPV